MMTKLLDALKQRFRTPQEAVKALGLDEALLEEIKDDPAPVIAHDDALLPPWASPRFTPAMAMDVGAVSYSNGKRTGYSINTDDATGHDPSNGQFTASGGGGSSEEHHRGLVKRHAQAAGKAFVEGNERHAGQHRDAAKLHLAAAESARTNQHDSTTKSANKASHALFGGA
jgi:hypothetical protein